MNSAASVSVVAVVATQRTSSGAMELPVTFKSRQRLPLVADYYRGSRDI
jgi:hypothetical protein